MAPPNSGVLSSRERSCGQLVPESLLTGCSPCSVFEAVKFIRRLSFIWLWGTAIPTRNSCSFRFCSSTGRVKSEYRKAFDISEILILFTATQRQMKSVVTAWKPENSVDKVELPVLREVFLIFLSRVGGRQKLDWPVILSHECCEHWFLCAPSPFV